jgi:ParB family transcriptional regulator, chromosome partitioning protein
MIRRPLGRGLDALIENTAPEAERPGGGAEVVMAAVGTIAPNPFQPRLRFDEDRLQELTRAIQSQGIIEPLIVRPRPGPAPTPDAPRYQLIAGERRLRAARAAGLEAVPVIVHQLDDRGALEMSLVENIAREELNPVDEARAFALLIKRFGLGHEEIAARIGKSRPYVSNAIRLIGLAVPVLEMIIAGQLSAGQARPLLVLKSEDAQVRAAQRIVEDRISARGAEQLAGDHPERRKSAAARRAEDPNLTALAESIQRVLKRKVRIVRGRGKNPGRIELDYYDDNDLNALAAMLMGQSRAAAAQASGVPARE